MSHNGHEHRDEENGGTQTLSKLSKTWPWARCENLDKLCAFCGLTPPLLLSLLFQASLLGVICSLFSGHLEWFQACLHSWSQDNVSLASQRHMNKGPSPLGPWVCVLDSEGEKGGRLWVYPQASQTSIHWGGRIPPTFKGKDTPAGRPPLPSTQPHWYGHAWSWALASQKVKEGRRGGFLKSEGIKEERKWGDGMKWEGM